MRSGFLFFIFTYTNTYSLEMIFYSTTIENGFCVLDKTESAHAIRVLRLKSGDIVELVDGIGGFFKAQIVEAHAKQCQLKIVEQVDTGFNRDVDLHIAIAPTKNNDRFEWFLEKSTELGINRITPLLCEHSERKVLKHERMLKILVSAMKQSQKAVLPQLDEMVRLNDFLKDEYNAQKMIAYVDKEHTQSAKDLYKSKSNLLMLIGPEGDFSPEEVLMAKENDFAPVSLGSERLRTETAGVAACAMFNVLNYW